MRDKVRQNVLTMLRPLEKVNQLLGWLLDCFRKQQRRTRTLLRQKGSLNIRIWMWSFPF